MDRYIINDNYDYLQIIPCGHPSDWLTTGSSAKTQAELAEAILASAHLPERALLATFVRDPAATFAVNPFARTSVAAVKHTWTVQAFEFPTRDIQAAGLTELLRALSTLPAAEPLTQVILRSGAHTLNAFHRGKQREIVGAVLYGRPHVPLPVMPAALPAKPRRRPRRFTGQLDLFAAEG